MLPAYFIIFGGGFAINFLCLFAVRRWALAWGFLDHPGDRKIHTHAVPYGGGISFFLCFFLTGIFYFIAVKMGWLQSWKTDQRLGWRYVFEDPRTWAIGFGGCCVFVIGLCDDLWKLSARSKLFWQSLAFGLTVTFGPKMSFFAPWWPIGLVGTVIWLLLITNAFNLLDNMDGLCATIACITLAIHFILLQKTGHYMLCLLTLFILALCVGFLCHNAPPARIYLGDAGSLLLGYSVAQLSVLSTYYREGDSVTTIAMPLLIMAIPLYDVVTVMLIRFKTGQPFFKADRNHFSHRLLKLGLSTWQTLLTIGSLSLAMGLGALLLAHSSHLETLIILIESGLIFLVIIILEKAGAKSTQTSES